jgi:hypothetical protein
MLIVLVSGKQRFRNRVLHALSHGIPVPNEVASGAYLMDRMYALTSAHPRGYAMRSKHATSLL